jgi:hypothetical protein
MFNSDCLEVGAREEVNHTPAIVAPLELVLFVFIFLSDN